MLNTDSLLALSIFLAYVYSVVQLFHDTLNLYFEVAGSLVAVVTIGRFLERSARVRATRELNTIMQAWSSKACVLKNGKCLVYGLEGLIPGDRVFVRSGEMVPVDGTIVGGQGAVDESLMTGKPFPVSRSLGGKALGGTVLREGELEIEVGSRVEGRLANLARILWNAQSSTGGIQGCVDWLSHFRTGRTRSRSHGGGVGFHIGGAPFEKAPLASLATLIVSCLRTFGLAIPLTTAAAIGSALRRGIIVTRADLFDKTPRIDMVAIDKTGTLSTDDMAVVEVVGSLEVAARAAAVERLSSHPIAKVIARLDAHRTARDIEIHPGRRALGSVGDRRVAVGGKAFFSMLGWTIPEPLAALLSLRRPGEVR
jgi:Cu2+-exporting ATPase